MLRPVPITKVRVSDDFWLPRLEANATTTIPQAFVKCEETGRIGNFSKAAGIMAGDHEGFVFNDSDVYKLIEGASYVLAQHLDAKLDAYLDELIATIAAAQRPDGYLNTYFTLVEPDHRWTDLRTKHELYCAGHLFEAAVAHHRATGKLSLLGVALKLADHIDTTFGPGKRRDVPGHPEIEIGLVRLFRATGEQRYLDLARFFLDERGNADHRTLYGPYAQDHMQVVKQEEAVGHAVRAIYLYCGMADVAALTGERSYLGAVDRLWENVVSRKLYVTGGVGARRTGEAFGDGYELPNDSAYAETCAAIANAMWNQRMFLLHKHARYVDVLERVLYNGLLSGVSLHGDRFFYPNPLASDGVSGFNQRANQRLDWFGCACCPTNVARFMPSLPGFLYAYEDSAIYVNLFLEGTAEVTLPDGHVRLEQQTRYPWDGKIRITIRPERSAEFTVHVRIPGWAVGSPVPSDLYRFLDGSNEEVALRVNGRAVAADLRAGYAVIRRTWEATGTIELDLPMTVRRLVSHKQVRTNTGRVALQRGPIVYCIEAVDHDGSIESIALPDSAILTPEHCSDLLGGITVLQGEAQAARFSDDGTPIGPEPVRLTAIPYHAWNHRGPGSMAVWLPRDPASVKAPRRPTIAATSRITASHVWPDDLLEAVNDRREPTSSSDSTMPRFTWWDHRGTAEWIQYDFAQPEIVSCIEVYWFDEAAGGAIRPPKRWHLLYRPWSSTGTDTGWQPVQGASAYGVERDRFNTVSFDAVKTIALRIEVELREGYSAGMLEWKVR